MPIRRIPRDGCRLAGKRARAQDSLCRRLGGFPATCRDGVKDAVFQQELTEGWPDSTRVNGYEWSIPEPASEPATLAIWEIPPVRHRVDEEPGSVVLLAAASPFKNPQSISGEPRVRGDDDSS